MTMRKWLPVFHIVVLGIWLTHGMEVARSQTIETITDIAYKTGETLTDYEKTRCKLDLYIPTEETGFPTLVFFHGGGLQEGYGKGDYARFVKRFADDGIAVVNVNYRLSPRVVFPAYIDDAAASVAWTYQNIDQYGGDPAKIFVSGHSAGGYLAAMLGMDPEYLNKYGVEVENIAGFIPVSGQMITHDAVRKERGIPETTPVIDEAAPVFYARRNVPPFLNICGGNDLPARAEENRYFVAALKAAGDRQVEYLEFEGRDHLSILGQLTESDDEVAQAMLAFIFGTQETSVDLWALH